MKIYIFFVIFLPTHNCYHLPLRVLTAPWDRGANIRGARFGPSILQNFLIKEEIFHTREQDSEIDVNVIDNMTTSQIISLYADLHIKTLRALDCSNRVLVLGGDHSISVSSISAAHNYCMENKKRLGVLWCDAHADFNTMKTSESSNIHGMPVAILCGHTVQSLQFFQAELLPYQFAYFGIRDVDKEEEQRFQNYNLVNLSDVQEFRTWQEKFDYLYVSFDVDCCDPSIAPGVSTPVITGKTKNEMLQIFKEVAKTKKLIGADCVEYNPLKDNKNKTAVLCANLLKTLFFE